MPLSHHSVPGTSAAFAYQFERALFWLAASQSGSAVGVETDDDVAIKNKGEARILEQDKHSIGDATNPFSDQSHALWNTLSTWVTALDDKEVQGDSTRFLMVTNKHVPKCIARQIGSARSKPEITACLEALKAVAAKSSRTIAHLTKRVLRPSSEENLRILIKQCELVDASSATASPELRQEIIGCLQLPTWARKIADSMLDELLGWLHRIAMAAWDKKQPAWINRDQFVNQFHAVLDCRKRQITRERAENLIPVPAETVGKQKGRPFVMQLYLITDDDSIVETGIREFIRCNIEKSRLSAEGNVADQDWQAFETTLRARWGKIQARIIRTSGSEPEKDIGFRIFSETTEDHREKLAGHDTEQVYLTSGTYHRMADTIQIGWHPRFKQLLKEILEAS